MDTKQRILDRSKDLLNEQGIQTTTLRQIASALKMSQGNLNYHFRTKQDIIERLYFELVGKLDREMASMTGSFSSLATIYVSAEITMKIFFEYRFLLRDMYLIFKENEKVKEHYINLQDFRKRQFAELFDTMIEKGVLRHEEFANEYSRLYERMAIVGDNWVNASELFRAGEDEPVNYYRDLMFEMIYPYLTEKGKREYHDLFH